MKSEFSHSAKSQRTGGRKDFAIWERALSYLANKGQLAAGFRLNFLRLKSYPHTAQGLGTWT